MALHEELEKQGANLSSSAKGLPLFVLILGYILFLASSSYPENYFFKNSSYEIIYEVACLALSMVGFAVVIYTNGYSANPTPLNQSGEAEADFDKTGAYSVVRHPLCSGLLIMWLGPAMVTGNLFFIVSFILFCCVFFERIMIAEEGHFKRKFGFKYSAWAEQVPALIPNLAKFRKPDKKFNLVRAFKNSAGQLSIVLLTFLILDGLKQILAVKPDYNDLYIFLLLISLLITAAGELDDSLKRKRS